MSLIHPRPPISAKTAYEHSAGHKKLAIRRFKARLRLVRWLTVPNESFRALPEYGLALFPRSPHVRWTWDVGGGQVFLSKPLIFFGFWRDTYPTPQAIL